MKHTIRIASFVLTIILILVVAVYLTLQIGSLRDAGERTAAAEYTIVRNSLTSIGHPQDLSDPYVREKLRSLFQASRHLLAMQILDRDGLVLWKIPDESPYFALPASKSPTVFRAPGMSTIIYMTPLQEGMKVMALYAVLSQKDVAQTLLWPGVGLALWLAVLVILQFALGKDEPGQMPMENEEGPAESRGEEGNWQPTMGEQVSEPQTESSSGRASHSASEEDHEDQEVPEREQPYQQFPHDMNRTASEPASEERLTAQDHAAPIEPSAISEVQAEKPFSFQEQTAGTETEGDQDYTAESSGDQEFIAPEIRTASPQGIYRTGFSPVLDAPALEELLSHQLARSQDRECSLLLIQYTPDAGKDPSETALAATIRDYIGTRDLVVQIAAGCHAVVLPGVDAGSCLKLGVDLDDTLTTTLSLYKDLAGEPPLHYGISARYGRQVSPSRLYREAYAALERTKEQSSSRILAFKPSTI
ncbi:MAG: hypothetical protein WHT81_05835 [Rectinemataceae bacterium]